MCVLLLAGYLQGGCTCRGDAAVATHRKVLFATNRADSGVVTTHLPAGACAQAEWQLSTWLSLPWRPRVQIEGRTIYTLNADANQVRRHRGERVGGKETLRLPQSLKLGITRVSHTCVICRPNHCRL